MESSGISQEIIMDLKERIISLLEQGIHQSIVAGAVGCDPSYVSQIMEDPLVKDKVIVAKSKDAEAQISRDKKWDQIEDKALEKVEKVLHLINRPGDLIKIASMANAAKRRSAEFAGVSDNMAPVVTFVLPEIAAVHFQMNAQAQVVSVGGKSMLPLSNQRLNEMANKQLPALTNNREELVEVAVPLPIAREKRKVANILEQMGYADEPVHVENVLVNSDE